PWRSPSAGAIRTRRAAAHHGAAPGLTGPGSLASLASMKFPRALLASLALAAAGAAAAEPPSPAVLKDLAPSGKLRVTFIVSNPVQVAKDASGFRGPAIDLGRELAKRLGVPFDPVGHPRAADIV